MNGYGLSGGRAAGHDVVREAEPAGELQGPGLHADRSRLPHGPALRVEDADADGAARELQREREARRAGAGDEDVRW